MKNKKNIKNLNIIPKSVCFLSEIKYNYFMYLREMAKRRVFDVMPPPQRSIDAPCPFRETSHTQREFISLSII